MDRIDMFDYFRQSVYNELIIRWLNSVTKLERAMFSKTLTVDKSGRIVLPQPILTALGVTASSESDVDVVVELTESGVILKPKQATPITDRIAAMALPVADWPQMEQEIEEGRCT